MLVAMVARSWITTTPCQNDRSEMEDRRDREQMREALRHAIRLEFLATVGELPGLMTKQVKHRHGRRTFSAFCRCLRSRINRVYRTSVS